MEPFHAHLYFTAATRDSALRLREALRTTTAFGAELQPVREEPMGPHTSPMFNTHIGGADFAQAIAWFMQHHGPHPVLIHPSSGNDLDDHTKYAMWLGPPQALNLDGL